MKIEVSLGEAIDKLNILELKKKKINDQEKIEEIQKEIDELKDCEYYKEKYDFFYHLLSFVNEFIWETTNEIKSLDVSNPLFNTLADDIFLYNQKRFRIKNWFNILENSIIKEQKSYYLTHISFNIQNESTIYKKIAEINYLLLSYDIVYFINSDENNANTIKKIFINPNLKIIESPFEENIIQLEELQVIKNKEQYEFQTINYISCGLLGDFIHQLSIINEKFIETGRKGNLFITDLNNNEKFRFGVETAFKDTYDLINIQLYINNYSIYNGEKIDINLSEWRNSPLLFHVNWHLIFKDFYNVEWGTHPWLILPKNDIWKDKIIINCPDYKSIGNINYKELYNKYGTNIIFISFNNNDYIRFIIESNINVEYYCPLTLYDFIIAINSCKLFLGSLSAPLAFAYAVNKDNIICGDINEYNFNNGLENILKCRLTEF